MTLLTLCDRFIVTIIVKLLFILSSLLSSTFWYFRFITVVINSYCYCYYYSSDGNVYIIIVIVIIIIIIINILGLCIADIRLPLDLMLLFKKDDDDGNKYY